MKKAGADWIHWSLHFLCGLVAGVIFGMFFVRGGRRGIPLIARELAPQFLLSMALLFGAVASHYGDRLWFGLTGRANIGDLPRHDPATLVASLLVGAAGVVLALLAACRSWGILE
jgi:hypothetical protein